MKRMTRFSRYVSEPRGRCGHTLLELSFAMAAGALVLGGISAAVWISSRAGSTDGGSQTTVDSSMVAGQLLEELRYATTVNNRSATHVEFVADRGGVPVTIRYAWSGTAGDPLTRQQDSGPLVTVLENVEALQLDYVTLLRQEVGPPTGEVESAEHELASHLPTSDLHDHEVKDNRWVGNFFRPTFAPDVLHWRVTRLEVSLKQKEDEEILRVQMRNAVGNLPSSNVIEEKTINSDYIGGSYAWYGFNFANVANIAPASGLCFTLVTYGEDAPAKARKHDKVTDPNLNLVKSDKQGNPWKEETDKALIYRVLGTVTTTGAPTTIDKYYLQRVHLTLQAGTNALSNVETAVQVLATPEVSP